MKALLHSVPLTLQQATASTRFCRDPWTLTGKSGSVSCGVTASFSWVLVCTGLFVLSKSLFPQSYVSSGGSMVGLMVTSSKRAMPYLGMLHPEPLPLWQATADLYLCRRHSNTVLSQSLWGLWVLVYTRFEPSGGYGV